MVPSSGDQTCRQNSINNKYFFLKSDLEEVQHCSNRKDGMNRGWKLRMEEKWNCNSVTNSSEVPIIRQ